MDQNENDELDARLRDAFADKLPDASALQQAVRSSIKRRRMVLMGAAAAGLLAIAGYEFLRPANFYSELARDHHREVVEHAPRHWRSSAGELSALAERYGLTAEALDTLAPAGYRLEHAKTCGMGGKPVLHLVYTNGNREFSLYVRRQQRALRIGAVHGSVQLSSERVAYFERDGFEGAVVTDLSERECVEWARRTASLL